MPAEFENLITEYQNWIQGPYAKYLTSQMGTGAETDPLVKLAETGYLPKDLAEVSDETRIADADYAAKKRLEEVTKAINHCVASAGHNAGNYKNKHVPLVEPHTGIPPIGASRERETTSYMDDILNGDSEIYSLRAPNFWVYAANVERLQKPTATHPIVQSYVDIFLNGCFQIQEEFKLESFAKDCVETTKEWSEHWVNDRIHPRRPFAIANAMKIDQMLSKYFTNYYNLKIE